ncbi:MAG: NADH-quinone oxidoreductase subunit NuoK [Planctomycetes bacterium]|nr:NADH-quinone oxidoreductase subunit NuoK [Planctomycetota bacterium]
MAEFGPDSLPAYLLVAGVLFAAGVLAIGTRRSAISVLIGIELMLNAAALQFVAYDRFATTPGPQGQAAAAFVIVVAAAEAAVALALLFAVYKTTRDVDLESTRELRS